MGISFGLLEEDDIPGIKELELSQGSRAHPADGWEEDFRWKFLQNPIGKSVVVMARDKKTPVGMMALLPCNIHAAGKTRYGGQAVDLLVDGKYRRKGVFKGIGKLLYETSCQEKMEFLYCVSNALGRNGHLKMGWFDVASWGNLAYPFKLGRSIKGYGSVSGGLLRKRLKLSAVKSAVKSLTLKKQLKGISCTECESFWENDGCAGGVRIAKPQQYLEWRYLKRPGKPYKIYKVQREKKCVGHLVTKVRPDEMGRIYLVDWIGENDSEAALYAFIEAGKEADCTAGVVRGCVSQKWKDQAVKLGFADMGPAPDNYPLARIETGAFSRTELGPDWFLLHGDTDHV